MSSFNCQPTIDVPVHALARNLAPRFPLVVIADKSQSMRGEKIRALNRAFPSLLEGIREDPIASQRVEIAILGMGAGYGVELIQDFASVDDIAVPNLNCDGTTPMGEALLAAISALDERKKLYRQSGILLQRPGIIVILTDGYPTDEWQDAAKQIRAGDANGSFSFMAVAIDEGCDMGVLAEIAPPSRPPLMLKNLESFASFFSWLSESVTLASTAVVSETANQIQLPPIDGWAAL